MARYSRIQQLLREADAAPTADAKGDKLEELARHLFEKVPGVSYADKNILDGNRAHELDVAFWNPQNRSKIGFLDSVLIVECKHTANPVGSADVGWFVRKLQDRGATSAVLVALNGITGSPQPATNAHSEVMTALVRDRIRLLVLTRNEIENLSTTDDLVDLLKKKLLRLALYKTVI